jgi:hypothetical protein
LLIAFSPGFTPNRRRTDLPPTFIAPPFANYKVPGAQKIG